MKTDSQLPGEEAEVTTMTDIPARKRKRIQKSVMFEEDVWLALETRMKRENNNNRSLMANDAVKYALFPEYRDDRNADIVKQLNQILYSLNDHRRKTARDMTILQEMLAQLVEVYFMHTHQIPPSENPAAEAQARARLEVFMERLVRRLPKSKPVAEAD